MTYREKAMIMCPERVRDDAVGGVLGCPFLIGGNKAPWCDARDGSDSETICRKCWDREIPGSSCSPQGILNDVLSLKHSFKDFTFVVTGKCGPTGKTWLTQSLRHNGFKAYEITEMLADSVIYVNKGNSNTVSVDRSRKLVLIVLSEPLNLEKPATKMTVSEIEEKLGYKIEVVAEK